MKRFELKFELDSLRWEDVKRLLILATPYICMGLFMTIVGKAWRISPGSNLSEKIPFFIRYLPVLMQRPLPSFHIYDLIFGIICGIGLRLAVYLKSKDAKKYRHNVEYGSARWGTKKDIAPFVAPKFEDNVILTATEIK